MTTRPIRVGYVLTAVWEGGLERFTFDLVRAMDRREFLPHLYVLTPHNPWLGIFQELDLPIRVFQGANKVSARTAWPILRTFGELASSLRRDRLDVLHTCDFFPAALGRGASLLAGVPRRIHTLHSLYDWYPRWSHLVNGLLARSTDAVTAVSASAAEAAMRDEGIPTSKLVTILNGADLDRFRPLPKERQAVRDELGLPEEAILIGSIGSLTTRKAHHLLVDAVAPLMASDSRLHVAIFGAAHGGPQDNLAHVQEAIRISGFSDRIRIHPPRPDVERLLSAFDLFCMPSIVEGLSLASVEAQLCGSLSVFSDIGPFREVVRDGENGFLFRSGDSISLRQALQRALELGASADPVRNAAIEDARARFDKRRMVGTYLDLYRSLASKDLS